MSKKKIKELNPGDVFLELGHEFIVEKTEELTSINILGIKPQTKCYLTDKKGNKFIFNFRSDQKVKLVWIRKLSY